MKAIISNPTIGADIEVFLKNKATNEIVSAEGYIKGSKHDPFIFDETNPYFAISLDNVAAEFCIPPATNETDWMGNIAKSLAYINSAIPDHLCTAHLPAAILDEKYLQTDNAKLFGCEPDYNVWLKAINSKPNAENQNLRSCGGHIHIGYSVDIEEAKKYGLKIIEVHEAVVKAMDLFIGLPSVIQEPDNERKLLYGKAGCFRPKPYGVEYRTVSNYYLQSEALTKWAYNNTIAAFDFVNSGRIGEVEVVGELIQNAINNSDAIMAGNIIRQFDINMC